ncbi:MAG TPA: hypothetical protein VFY18_10415 [Candidatus Limnocylindrales bacterium]|nr:hypothetical protein [Candidatus Limnocylindrales bacterium]
MQRLRAIATVLGARLEMVVRWQAGDLGRLLNARHAAMHEAIARRFAPLTEWVFEPEVSFSVYGERGVIDGLACHAASESLLVIELKTEFVDINDLMAGVDRKRRLATGIASERGWIATSVSCWVVVAESRTNRRAFARHRTALRAKFPEDGRAVRAWLRAPRGKVNGLGFVTNEQEAHGGVAVAGARRVRPARARLPSSDLPAE